MTKVIVRGKSGQLLQHYFTRPLTCSWGALLFCHSFLIVPEIPVPLLGWDLPSQLKAQILLPQQLSLLPPPSGTKDSTVWTDGMTVGRARMALPIQVKLKNLSQFPRPKQYPLKPDRPYAYHKFLKKKPRATN
jgi:hypothetical protein